MKIFDENGKEKEYNELAIIKFKNKNFIIYTDYSTDENKNIKIYSAIYDEKTKKLEKIADPNEKNFIAKYVKQLEEDLK